MNNLLAVISTGIKWLDVFVTAVFQIINPVLILISVAGIIYAIVIGIKFVKAEDKSQRDEAKQKLIIVIVGIVVTLVLIAVFYYLAYALSSGQIDPTTWLK